MEHWARHLRGREYRFLALVLMNLACVAGFLSLNLGHAESHPGGWRRIDLQALERRIQAGDLTTHDALWFHALEREPVPVPPVHSDNR